MTVTLPERELLEIAALDAPDEVTALTRQCLAAALATADGDDTTEHIAEIERAAAGWARTGVPIDAVHHAVHSGYRIGLDLVAARRTEGEVRRDDYDTLVAGMRAMLTALDRMTTAISMAYVRELRSAAADHHTAVHTLTSALLGGYSTSTMTRECGIEPAERYAVLALQIPTHPDAADPALDGDVVVRRTLRRAQAALAAHAGRDTLALLSVDGGTVLLPAHTVNDASLEALIAELTAAARVPITATVVHADKHAIPDAADRAHQLLDTVTLIGARGGLHRFERMALEFQLTRPGPARDCLAAILNPLDEHPELLATLRTHLENDFNRQLTARQLHIHANTVDHRLKRIAQFTGLDPTCGADIWKLRSALVARSADVAAPRAGGDRYALST
ncbi:PucR family transcriptional regulator [Nocardia asteroides]|uniref:PucR family transcriptional regulator n=1 Tax=Nocardia asteroides TaxID=1824 RepID=UPI001E34DFC7|nr:helix-turn-helix domain-containing protein [Nocardia asteroides]UGT64234.1 helix-turn-helix domain-containing protein [Nocardia asteroides]